MCGRHPVPRVTIAGGVGKMTKLAQGLLDLHSRRGSVDLAVLAELAKGAGGSEALAARILASNTAAEAFAHAEQDGIALGDAVARAAHATAATVVAGKPIEIEIAVFDRDGRMVGHAPFALRSCRSSPEAAAIVGVIERALAEVLGRQGATDQDQSGALDWIGGKLGLDIAERSAHDPLIGPACLGHHRDRAVGAIERDQLGDDPVERMDGEMDGERGTGRGESGKALAASASARRGRQRG